MDNEEPGGAHREKAKEIYGLSHDIHVHGVHAELGRVEQDNPHGCAFGIGGQ
jgi:hypothetical protein